MMSVLHDFAKWQAPRRPITSLLLLAAYYWGGAPKAVNHFLSSMLSITRVSASGGITAYRRA